MLLSVLVLLFAVQLQAQVTSFFDQSVDLSKYSTYSFLGWQQNSDSILTEIDKERLQKAFRSEFDARNLSYVQSGGDMMVSLYIFIDVKSESIAYSDFVVNSGMTPLETSISGGDYEEGTLVLSCYDAKEETLFFQGVKVKTIQKNPSKREKTIPKAVAKLMREFPIEKSK